MREPALVRTTLPTPAAGRRRAVLAVASPAPPAAWREVLQSDPAALVTQTPEWTAALCRDGRFEDASRLYELGDGRLAVLPMLRRPGLPPGWAVEASLPPACGIGGLIATGGLRDEDVRAVFAELAARPHLRTSLTPNPLQASAWAAACPPGCVTVPRLAHVLELGRSFDEVWRRSFAGTARTAVRKAERAGLTVRRDTTGELVEVFYELFERSLRRWADQQHEPTWLAAWRGRRRDPVGKLRSIAALGDMCRIWVAFSAERPAAAILVLQGENAHYTRGAMDKDLAGPTRANYLLHSLAIEEACAAGCRWYHMGETGGSRSLAQFKTRFGARPHPHADYHLERLPLTAADRRVRAVVKRTIGFRD
ncbi:MAG TPA: GNAT family N-acetyltransferase [Solirubrobacteraceae bacterium]|nr:GNAT family N-acetyltransferase [Solirubrobacteraceae bacterium]